MRPPRPPVIAPPSKGHGYSGPAGSRVTPRPAGTAMPGPMAPFPQPGRGLPVGPGTQGPAGRAPGRLVGPYTIGAADVHDATAWQLWWEFNGAPYLDLRSIDTRAQRTGAGDFFLGQGQRNLPNPGGRVDADDVEREVLPALKAVIESGGDIEFLRATIVSATQATRALERTKWWMQHSLEYFLENNDTPRIREIAAACLGTLGDESAASLLLELAIDSPRGRALVGEDEVEAELRAHAIYGLALLAPAAGPHVRREVVDELVTIIDDDGEPETLRAAAVYAMGFAPLPATGGGECCTCGECELGTAADHLEGQVTWLVRLLHDKREGDVVRAQTAGSLARLVSGLETGASARLEEDVADLLIKALDPRSRQPHAVRQTAVLGLGMMGDADDDTIDAWIRWALHRSLHVGDPVEKRFALMGMAMVASRPGSGAEPLAATEELRSHLVHHLTRGKRSAQPWAALSLGVMGHWLRANEIETSDEVDTALRTALRNCRDADDLGAYALAVGLRRDLEAGGILLEKFDRTRDPVARGYVALGIGLVQERAGIEPMRETLLDDKADGYLRRDVGLGLGMLRDSTVVESLVASLVGGDRPESEAGVAYALGGIGDSRSVTALKELFQHRAVRKPVRTAAARALGRMSDPDPVDWRSRLAAGTNYLASPATLTNPERTGLLDRLE